MSAKPSTLGGGGSAMSQPQEGNLVENPLSPPAIAQLTQNKQQQPGKYPKTLSALDICCTDFHIPGTVIPGILNEGLTVFAGKPKVGKSELARSLCYAVATGIKAFGEIEVVQGAVLYLALEDTQGRLKDRLAKSFPGVPPSNLIFSFEWPVINNNGLESLENYLQDHKETKLVVIDTLARIRGGKGPKTSYGGEYEVISGLKRISDKYKISLVVIHHLRKSGANDILDLVNGSTGITAAADYIVILNRERTGADAMLYVTGRGIEEQEYALRFNRDLSIFELQGQGEEYRLSVERREILEFLKLTEGPIKLKHIAQAVGKKDPVVHKHLAALVKIEIVEQPNYGEYQITKKDANKSGNDGESGETLAKENNNSPKTE